MPAQKEYGKVWEMKSTSILNILALPIILVTPEWIVLQTVKTQMQCGITSACTDPGSLARRGPTLQRFLFFDERIQITL